MSSQSQIYKRKPLNHPSEEIRLASIVRSVSHHDTIECRLFVVAFNNAPHFTALSYVWGDPEVTAEIMLDNEPVQVTTNLCDALTRLRARTDHEYIWIDAICIDQSSIPEKNQQVPLMGAIYGEAAIVYMWLGESHEDSNCALDFIERWNATARTVEFPEEDRREDRIAWSMRVLAVSRARWDRDPENSVNPFSTAAWEATKKLLGRPYWRRVWIVQEILLAKYGTILCGSKSLSYNDLAVFWGCWSNISRHVDLTTLSADERRNMFAVNLGGLTTVLSLDSWMRQHASGFVGRELDPAVTVYGHRATNPRDKIYAILALLSSNRPFIPVSYELSAAAVYRTFALAYLRARKRLDWLGLAGRSLAAIGQHRPRLSPSWVPDFERLPTLSAVSTHADTRHYRAVGDAEASCTVAADNATLTMRGATVDVVKHVSPVLDSFEEDKIANWICRCWDLAGRCCRALDPPRLQWWQVFALSVCNEGWNVRSPVEMDASKLKEFAPLVFTLLAFLQESVLSPYSIWATRERSVESQTETATTLLSEEERSEAIEETFIQVVDMLNGLDGVEDMDYAHALTAGGAYPTMREHLLINVCSFSFERSFFITQRGYMGIGSPDMVPGDEIVVTLGCSVPLVWRLVRQRTYEAVGDAFIFGMMMGEMMDEVNAGRLELQELTLV